MHTYLDSSRCSTSTSRWKNKPVVFKSCAIFPDHTNKINNTQVDSAKYVDIMMPMYNLLRYSDDH